MSDCRTRWWIGLTCDHIYPDCPNRTRAEKTLRQSGWWEPPSELFMLDVHGTDVCGMCLHRHNRSAHKAAS